MRRENRRFGEAYERMALQVAANESKSQLRNPTRFVPDFHGNSNKFYKNFIQISGFSHIFVLLQL